MQPSSAAWLRPGFDSALQQFGHPNVFGPRRERWRRPKPPQLLDIEKELRVRSERGEPLEQQRSFELIPQHIGREALDRPVLVQQASRADGSIYFLTLHAGGLDLNRLPADAPALGIAGQAQRGKIAVRPVGERIAHRASSVSASVTAASNLAA